MTTDVAPALRTGAHDDLVRLGAYERPTRYAIAALTLLFGVIGLLSIASDEGPPSTARTVVALLVCASTPPVALWWIQRGRLGSRLSPWFVFYADVGVTIDMATFAGHELVFFASTLYVIVGVYASFFVGGKWVALHGVFVSIVIGWIAWITYAEGEVTGWSLAARLTIALSLNIGVLVLLQRFAAEVRAVVRTQADLVESDPLTGLLNRRGFENATRRVAASTPPGVHVAIMSIDIDNFKSVNDIHGHAMGDDVIRLVARRLMAVLGSDASVARSGGEEFTVATTAPKAHMSALADRVGRALAISDDPVPVTVSVGAATLVTDNEDESFDDALHAALRMADSAMYIAKRAGGNRAGVAGD